MSQGQHLWSTNCASCHGTSGEGGSAPALNSQEFLTSVTDEQIHGIIAGGIPGTAMPAWLNDYGGPLTDQQIAALVDLHPLVGEDGAQRARLAHPEPVRNPTMQPPARTRRPTGVTLALVAASAMLLTACQNAGSAGDANTVAMIPNYQGGGQSSQPQPQGYTQPTNVITVALGESDPNTMYIHMSAPVAPEGPVSFIVTNEGTETHEFVVLQTETPAADFPIVSLRGRGEPDRRGRQGRR